MAKICVTVWHLRGWAKRRSVASTRYCLQHNMGMGGATVVTIYKRIDGEVAPRVEDTKPEEDGRSRLGYNPAEEARSISREDWKSVLAEGEASSAWAAAELPWNLNPGAYSTRAKL